MLDYATHAKADSMYNTPPTYAIYIAGLVFQLAQATGGLAGDGQRNRAKAALLYDYLDHSDYYANPVEPADRSRMNVPFTLADAGVRRRLPRGRADVAWSSSRATVRSAACGPSSTTRCRSRVSRRWSTT